MRISAILPVVLRLGFYVGFAVIVLLALEPHPPPIGARWDKLNHMAAFFALTATARMLWSRRSGWLLALAMISIGGLIELLQLWLPFGRDAEWLDWAADVFAIFVGLGVGALALRLMPRRLGRAFGFTG